MMTLAECTYCQEREAAAKQAVQALQWCMDEMPAGIDWGGPFDDEHPQGMYHCSHCGKRFEPGNQDEQLTKHGAGCGLVLAQLALNRAKASGWKVEG